MMRSAPVMPRASTVARPAARYAAWQLSTPFGSPVVPEV